MNNDEENILKEIIKIKKILNPVFDDTYHYRLNTLNLEELIRGSYFAGKSATLLECIKIVDNFKK